MCGCVRRFRGAWAFITDVTLISELPHSPAPRRTVLHRAAAQFCTAPHNPAPRRRTVLHRAAAQSCTAPLRNPAPRRRAIPHNAAAQSRTAPPRNPAPRRIAQVCTALPHNPAQCRCTILHRAELRAVVRTPYTINRLKSTFAPSAARMPTRDKSA